MEAVVEVINQDKLKRDRIGIIFKKSKSNTWDACKKFYNDIKGQKNSSSLMENYLV